jgi:hypothetical protein
LGRRYQLEKRYIESLDAVEKALEMKMHAFGEHDQETLKTKHLLSEVCNLVAMAYLGQDNFAMSL